MPHSELLRGYAYAFAEMMLKLNIRHGGMITMLGSFLPTKESSDSDDAG